MRAARAVLKRRHGSGDIPVQYSRDEPLGNPQSFLRKESFSRASSGFHSLSGNQKANYVLSDFLVMKVLFRGDSGSVSKAKVLDSNEIVVLKQRRWSELGKNEDLLHEVRILEKLRHPNVIRCMGHFRDVSVVGKTLYMVLDYCNGGDLHHAIEEFKVLTRNNQQLKQQEYLEEKQLWGIFKQLLSGLTYLHAHSIVHRDIKSLNIFLIDPSPNSSRKYIHGSKLGGQLLKSRNIPIVKIGDFGVGREVGKATMLMSTFYGTPLYASPEICRNEPYDERTDIWSLGIVLYEMAALKPPFYDVSLLGLARQIEAAVWDPLPQATGYTQSVSECLCRMLQPIQENRPYASEMLAWFGESAPASRSRSATTASDGTYTVSTIRRGRVSNEYESKDLDDFSQYKKDWNNTDSTTTNTTTTDTDSAPSVSIQHENSMTGDLKSMKEKIYQGELFEQNESIDQKLKNRKKTRLVNILKRKERHSRRLKKQLDESSNIWHGDISDKQHLILRLMAEIEDLKGRISPEKELEKLPPRMIGSQFWGRRDSKKRINHMKMRNTDKSSPKPAELFPINDEEDNNSEDYRYATDEEINDINIHQSDAFDFCGSETEDDTDIYSKGEKYKEYRQKIFMNKHKTSEGENGKLSLHSKKCVNKNHIDKREKCIDNSKELGQKANTKSRRLHKSYNLENNINISLSTQNNASEKSKEINPSIQTYLTPSRSDTPSNNLNRDERWEQRHGRILQIRLEARKKAIQVLKAQEVKEAEEAQDETNESESDQESEHNDMNDISHMINDEMHITTDEQQPPHHSFMPPWLRNPYKDMLLSDVSKDEMNASDISVPKRAAKADGGNLFSSISGSGMRKLTRISYSARSKEKNIRRKKRSMRKTTPASGQSFTAQKKIDDNDVRTTSEVIDFENNKISNSNEESDSEKSGKITDPRLKGKIYRYNIITGRKEYIPY